jgi:photosystem II stability/assembly factor-like uncharacterized protein
MAERSDRVLFAGTVDGLYLIEEKGGEFDARLIGFKGMGVMRAPVVQDEDDARRLYAGTTKVGLFLSEDGGESWQERNQGIRYKDVWSIAQHPLTRTLWAGTSPADVFRSDDRGETWQECESLHSLPSTKGWTGPLPPHVSRMKSLALDVNDPAAIYGAIEEGWAVRSLDGGTTWGQLEEGMDHDAHYITVMPDSSEVILATGGKGVYRSIDRGTTWSKREEGLESFRYTPAYVVVRPSRPRELLTTVTKTGPGGWGKPEPPGVAFARSADQGETWQILPNAVSDDFHPVPRGLVGDPEVMDTCYAGMTDGSVWMSTDDGEHFEQIVGRLPPVQSLAVGRR